MTGSSDNVRRVKREKTHPCESARTSCQQLSMVSRDYRSEHNRAVSMKGSCAVSHHFDNNVPLTHVHRLDKHRLLPTSTSPAQAWRQIVKSSKIGGGNEQNYPTSVTSTWRGGHSSTTIAGQIDLARDNAVCDGRPTGTPGRSDSVQCCVINADVRALPLLE